MNFKLILIFFSMAVTACGHKTKPSKPSSVYLPKVLDQYHRKFHAPSADIKTKTKNKKKP